MNFGKEKKGYSIKEVDAFIEKTEREYKATLDDQKSRIFELKRELGECEKKIAAYKEKSGLVTKAIYNAVAKAEEIERVSQLRYNEEIMQLKAFHEKWLGYYNKILEKYPLDDELLSAAKFNSRMSAILKRTGNVDRDKKEDTVKELEKNFESESARLGEKRIGYITVKTDDDENDDDDLLESIIPGAREDSPINTGEFNPIERINRYFSKGKPSDGAENGSFDADELDDDGEYPDSADDDFTAAANDKPPADYPDRSESGFSFQEALNPQEALEDIMRDLGLLLDEED